jgi:hypothetical protein
LSASLLRDGLVVFGAAVELARRQNLNRGWKDLHPWEEAHAGRESTHRARDGGEIPPYG